jgi:DNA replication protein DnaC
VYYDLPLDHPDRGRAFPCDCTRILREQRRRSRLFEECGLGPLSRHTFDSFSLREGEVPQDIVNNLFDVSEAVRVFAAEPWPRGWLFLTGHYGSGKSHLAAAAVNHRIMVMNRPALFVFVPEFLDHLRSVFAPSSEADFDSLFERAKRSEFLVLDDLGAHYGTAWANDKLFQLFNHRYIAELPTVITTNEDVEKIEGRIRSRLLDGQLTSRWTVQAPDYRTDPKAPQRTPFSSDELADAVVSPRPPWKNASKRSAAARLEAVLTTGNAVPTADATSRSPGRPSRAARSSGGPGR